MIPQNFQYKTSGNVESFDHFASLSIANGAAGNPLSFIVPASVKRGFLTLIGLGINNPTAFETSVWRLQINDASVRYYDNIQDELAPFNDPKEIAPVLVRGGDKVSVRVENNGAAAFLYAARLRGFYDYAWNAALGA